MSDLFASIDAARLACGFLPMSQMMEILDGNHVLDPFSTLVSAGVSAGKNNIFYPGVTLKASSGAEIRLGDDNIVHSGSHFEASNGNILIGSKNQFGEGGFTAKANRPGAEIRIGSHGRFLNNPALFGRCMLGDGSQILGNITVDTCTLSDGGSFQEDDPDMRGGLLKGSGVCQEPERGTRHGDSRKREFQFGRPAASKALSPKALTANTLIVESCVTDQISRQDLRNVSRPSTVT